MPHLLEVGLKRAITSSEANAFPFTVKAIATLPKLDVNVPVTLFVGENGSGKSTLLEAIAAAAELPSLGVSEIAVDNSLSQQRKLATALRLAWRPRSRQGFFLRAEDFFGHVRAKARDLARYVRERDEVEGRPHTQSNDGPGALHIDEQEAARYIGRFDARSHGESFLDLFSTRVQPRGLYVLDEPEAPLSPKRQLVLLRLIVRAAEEGAQFIIATHSPILLACPDARIFTFDEPPIHHVFYDELEHVSVMRNFLNDPEGHLRDLLAEEE